jgi:hypothetical protein
MSFVKLFAEIWRDYVTLGNPASGAWNPVKADIRAWGAAVESAVTTLNPRYTWDTATADADPGSGKLRANNATLASATLLFVSETDANGAALASLIATWDDSSNTVRGTLTLRDLADVANYAIFSVTGANSDAGTYDKIAVTFVNGGGSFAADADIGIQFQRAGDAGTIGGSTGGTDNRLLRADGTGGATAQSSAIAVDDSGNVSGVGTLASGLITQSGVTLWQKAVKSSDESVISSTTLQNDDDLKFAMLANTNYRFRCFLLFDTGATGDFKYRHTGPASPTRVRIKRSHVVGAGTAYAGIALDQAYSAADIAIAGAAGTGWVELEGMIQNGANAGNFQIQWAQNASEAVNTTVLQGSYIEWRVI